MPDDNELMARTALGDTEAFSQLVQKKRVFFERYAFSLLKDEGLSQDVVAACFTRLYTLRASYQPSFSFDTFFRTLVKNKAIDELRRKKVPAVPLSSVILVENKTPESEFLQKEEKARVLSALDALAPEQRQLLMEYALEGKSYRELSKRFHLSVPQVKITLHRIRVKLRQLKGD